jgi:hypothetical protein
MQIAVPHAALRYHRVGKGLNLVDRTAEHGDLRAVVVIEMNVQRRNRKIVIIVLFADQPLCEITGLVLVDISEGGHPDGGCVPTDWPGNGRYESEAPA